MKTLYLAAATQGITKKTVDNTWNNRNLANPFPPYDPSPKLHSDFQTLTYASYAMDYAWDNNLPFLPALIMDD